LGGSSGTLNILHRFSLDLNKELSKELNLSIAEMPWHNNRENIVELASVLTSITSIAFEDKKIDAKNNIVYEIKSILGHKLKKSLKFKIIEDPALIGGIKVRIGNKFLDSTIKSQLSEMKQSLIESKRN